MTSKHESGSKVTLFALEVVATIFIKWWFLLDDDKPLLKILVVRKPTYKKWWLTSREFVGNQPIKNGGWTSREFVGNQPIKNGGWTSREFVVVCDGLFPGTICFFPTLTFA